MNNTCRTSSSAIVWQFLRNVMTLTSAGQVWRFIILSMPLLGMIFFHVGVSPRRHM